MCPGRRPRAARRERSAPGLTAADGGRSGRARGDPSAGRAGGGAPTPAACRRGAPAATGVVLRRSAVAPGAGLLHLRPVGVAHPPRPRQAQAARLSRRGRGSYTTAPVGAAPPPRPRQAQAVRLSRRGRRSYTPRPVGAAPSPRLRRAQAVRGRAGGGAPTAIAIRGAGVLAGTWGPAPRRGCVAGPGAMGAVPVAPRSCLALPEACSPAVA